ncbi:uncharacterized protein LOC21385048 [Morus notabilis]|uniref:uncharacterized protein LOC21385048 n=1 Tax=Morus notabilis TaxID=981085 RepID=UPI000CED79EC|nr:uncharacterized protein LOC21385048 [Morus notabilis]
MGTRNFLVIKTHLDLLHKRLLNRVAYGNMVGVVGSIWVFVWDYLYFVFGFIARYLFRLEANDEKNKGDLKCADIDVFGEKEVDFHVQNRSKDDHDESEEVSKDCDVLESSSGTNTTNKYEFFSSMDINGFLEEPKALSFTVQELYLGSNEFSTIFPDYQIPKNQFSSEEDFLSSNSEAEEAVGVEESEDVKLVKELPEIETSSIKEVLEKQEEEEEQQKELSKTETLSIEEDLDKQQEEQEKELSKTETSSIKEVLAKGGEDENSPETELSEMDHDFSKDIESFSETHSSPSSDAKPVPNNISGDVSSSDEETFIIHSNINYEFEDFKPVNNIQAIEENEKKLGNVEGFLSKEHTDFDDEEEYIELEPRDAKSPKSFSAEKCSVKFEDQYEEKEKEESVNCEGKKLEFAWEHEDIIEQLKWELRNARTGGLPTIFEEESDLESPKKEDDHRVNLKPMKIELKFGYKDRIEEIQKVYRMYAEKMRKLDILNNQTMHAIGFLQLKDQFKSIPNQKPTVPIIKSLLPRKLRKEGDSILKYTGKLQDDFELVYVGQVCLSWEILHWQHRKIQDLFQNDDARGSHQYNIVASDFQLFQVLLQRFVEDESFQGPRVQNYVKNRCVIRSLMQVPAIKDDCVKDKKYLMEGNEDAIFCETLEKIIVEAMFTFWEFLRKDEKSNNLKFAQQTATDPVDSKLLMGIKKEFQKKERKVKDIQRSGNCVVKKLQKQQGGGLQHALFLAQVELRLVSRVLSMSRLTRDQLIWCQQKLNQIGFVNRKVHMEASFLLFPC